MGVPSSPGTKASGNPGYPKMGVMGGCPSFPQGAGYEDRGGPQFPGDNRVRVTSIPHPTEVQGWGE